MRDDGREVVVVGGEVQDVTAGEGRAPGDDARGVDAGERARVGDGGPPVLVLPGDAEDAAGLAVAVAEAAVVEHEDREARLREPLGVRVQAHAADAGEAVGHDDDRRGVDPVRAVEARTDVRFSPLVAAASRCHDRSRPIPGASARDRRTTPVFTPIRIVRFWLPALIFVAGAVMIAVSPDIVGVEGAALMLGGGLGVVVSNRIHKIGLKGDVDRDRENEARAFFDRYGVWPDEADAEQLRAARRDGLLPHGVASR